MRKLKLIPTNTSYSVSLADGNVSNKLKGGRSRVRKQSIGDVNVVSVSFVLDPDQYQYLMAFYRVVIDKGALPFLMDMITEDSRLVTHKVTMIPASFNLGSQQGLAYTVNFQVEAEPLDSNGDKDSQTIQNYESNKNIYTPPNQGWGNFFTATELDENETNVQDGIYRINGESVISLRNSRGEIFQTKYSTDGVYTRFLRGGKWAGWVLLGGQRLRGTVTRVYDGAGNLIQTFDGDKIAGNLPDGDYTLKIVDLFEDGSERVKSTTKQKIKLGNIDLVIIPGKYCLYLSWTVPAKNGGYTEVWLSADDNFANAKIIAGVDWPIDTWTFPNAQQDGSYYFWVRSIDRRGIEGRFAGPVRGVPVTPFEEQFEQMRQAIGRVVAAAERAADAKIKEFDKSVGASMKKLQDDVNATVASIGKKRAITLDDNGYTVGHELIIERVNGESRGRIKFDADLFSVGKRGRDIAPFIVDTRTNTVGINGSLVVNGEAIIQKLNAGTIDAVKIKTGTVTTNHLAANSVVASKIAANAITSDKIAANAITANKISANAISGDHIVANATLRAPSIMGGSLNINNRFIVDNTGSVTIQSESTRKGLKFFNNKIVVLDERGNIQIELGEL